MMRHEGPARVFDSEEAAIEAIPRRGIQPRRCGGHQVRNGPKGRPGMREMFPHLGHCRDGADREVALLTDGRPSGASRGASIGHISTGGG